MSYEIDSALNGVERTRSACLTASSWILAEAAGGLERLQAPHRVSFGDAVIAANSGPQVQVLHDQRPIANGPVALPLDVRDLRVTAISLSRPFGQPFLLNRRLSSDRDTMSA